MISMVGMVDEYVGILDDPRDPDGAMHPSEMWHCDRRAVYTLRGVDHSDPYDLRSQRRFLLGHMVHDLVRQSAVTSPDVAQAIPEFAVDDEWIRGHGDILLELDDGTWVLVEVKSMSKLRPLAVRDLMQAKSYAASVRSHPFASEDGRMHPALGERLIGIILVYVDRSTLTVKEFFRAYDPAWEAELIDRIALLRGYIADPRSLPPKLQAPKKGQRAPDCFTCPLASRCRRDGAGREPATRRD